MSQLQWLAYIPVRAVLWPAIWWDRRQRRFGKKPDEWYWADAFLCSKGHLVTTTGKIMLRARAIKCQSVMGSALRKLRR